MCGRFYSDNEIAEMILHMAGHTAGKLDLPKPGDIYPSQQALILSGKEPDLYAQTMHWGLDVYKRQILPCTQSAFPLF